MKKSLDIINLKFYDGLGFAFFHSLWFFCQVPYRENKFHWKFLLANVRAIGEEWEAKVFSPGTQTQVKVFLSRLLIWKGDDTWLYLPAYNANSHVPTCKLHLCKYLSFQWDNTVDLSRLIFPEIFTFLTPWQYHYRTAAS